MARKTRKAAETEGLKPAPSASRRGGDVLLYPDAWALDLRLKVDGHAFSMRGREFQRQILRDESQHIVIPKGAQLGLTTVFIIRCFHWIVKRHWHHLYLLPLKAGSVPFVQTRIDPVIESNKSLDSLFSAVDNRLNKQTNDGIALRVRGTNIETELREIPADVIVFDERDKMTEKNIPEAMARLDGSVIQRIVELSTPTSPGHGVDGEGSWHRSDKHRWAIACPHCSRRQVLSVDQNVEIGDSVDDCRIFCCYCKKTISDNERRELNATGEWVAEDLSGSVRGYHISQLNSPTKPIAGFMKNYFDGLTNPKKMRAWFNNNRGEPYTAFGDQITPDLLDSCIPPAGHRRGGLPQPPIYIGADVGNVIHVRADYLDRWDRRIFWQAKIFRDKPGKNMWRQFDEWLEQLAYFTCVVDAHPEKTEAKDLSRKYHKRFWVGFEQDRPDQAETAVFNNPSHGDVGKVTIDRTAAFDTHMKRMIDGRMILPNDAREIGETHPNLPYNGYYYQLCQQAAEEEEDAKGRPVRRWVKNNNADHWHHADMFCEIATMKKPYTILTPRMGEMIALSGSLVN